MCIIIKCHRNKNTKIITYENRINCLTHFSCGAHFGFFQVILLFKDEAGLAERRLRKVAKHTRIVRFNCRNFSIGVRRFQSATKGKGERFDLQKLKLYLKKCTLLFGE